MFIYFLLITVGEHVLQFSKKKNRFLYRRRPWSSRKGTTLKFSQLHTVCHMNFPAAVLTLNTTKFRLVIPRKLGSLHVRDIYTQIEFLLSLFLLNVKSEYCRCLYYGIMCFIPSLYSNNSFVYKAYLYLSNSLFVCIKTLYFTFRWISSSILRGY